jgi:hypothetical protein
VASTSTTSSPITCPCSDESSLRSASRLGGHFQLHTHPTLSEILVRPHDCNAHTPLCIRYANTYTLRSLHSGVAVHGRSR